jgi:hypothetical protein
MSLHELAGLVENVIIREKRTKKPQLELDTLRRLENAAFYLRCCAAYVFRLDRFFSKVETEPQFQQNLSYDLDNVCREQYILLNEKPKTNRN